MEKRGRCTHRASPQCNRRHSLGRAKKVHNDLEAKGYKGMQSTLLSPGAASVVTIALAYLPPTPRERAAMRACVLKRIFHLPSGPRAQKNLDSRTRRPTDRNRRNQRQTWSLPGLVAREGNVNVLALAARRGGGNGGGDARRGARVWHRGYQDIKRAEGWPRPAPTSCRACKSHRGAPPPACCKVRWSGKSANKMAAPAVFTGERVGRRRRSEGTDCCLFIGSQWLHTKRIPRSLRSSKSVL